MSQHGLAMRASSAHELLSMTSGDHLHLQPRSRQPIPNGRSLFSTWASTVSKKMLWVALAAQLLFALCSCSCGHSTMSSCLYLSAACASCWTSLAVAALQRKSEMRQVTKKMKIAPTLSSNCPTHRPWCALQVTQASKPCFAAP